jgi:hypothetical protein
MAFEGEDPKVIFDTAACPAGSEAALGQREDGVASAPAVGIRHLG